MMESELKGKRIAFYTLGCKLNFSETATIQRLVQEKGMIPVDFRDDADVYVINTCSVTGQAEKKCRNIVRRAVRADNNHLVILMGCYAQLRPDELADLGVDLVLGIDEKQHLPDHLLQYYKNNESRIALSDPRQDLAYFPAHSLHERTRSFLKIQDGCDYFCAYCTIPYARGRSRSCTIDQTLHAAASIIRKGMQEIVLTGVNLGDFGKHQHQSFLELAKELDQLPGDYRYRISSIEPDLLTTETISFLLGSNHFTPHFHLPLQAGSDKVLQAMGRKYDTRLFESRVNCIKALCSRAAIGVDVIAGFPGESDADFQDTMQFLQALDISYGHVFPFSARPGTRAEKMKPFVPSLVVGERVKSLLDLLAVKQKEFYKRNANQNAMAIFEMRKEGYAYGYTDHYVHVRVQADEKLRLGVRMPVALGDMHNEQVINAAIQ